MKHSVTASLLFLMLASIVAMPTIADDDVSVGISVNFGPPLLPEYEQPLCPGAGYIWTPGYWAYDRDDEGYFWVPGTWILPPAVALLWTPGYWGWESGYYWWHPGYWSPHVGFYGGINYGFGYTGEGYAGGHWQNGVFFYNVAVTNVDVTYVHETYNEELAEVANANRVSYAGGEGGIRAAPTEQQKHFASEWRVTATPEQHQHERAALANPRQRFLMNNGTPPSVATAQPLRLEQRQESTRANPGIVQGARPEQTVRTNLVLPASPPPAKFNETRVNNAGNVTTEQRVRSGQGGRISPAPVVPPQPAKVNETRVNNAGNASTEQRVRSNQGGQTHSNPKVPVAQPAPRRQPEPERKDKKPPP